MRTLILVAHPEEEESGTQRFLAEAIKDLPNVSRRVLSNEQQKPFQAQAEMHDVILADRIIWQFPLYWYSAPAVLHKWMSDCLITPYKEKLRGKELGIVVSIGRPENEFGMGKKQHYSLSEIFRPFAAIAANLQMTMMPYFVSAQFEYQTEKQHQQLLIDYQQYVELSADFSFSSQEHWYVQRLEHLERQATDPQRQNTLRLIKEQLSARSSHLSELKEEVAMIKNSEEGDQ